MGQQSRMVSLFQGLCVAAGIVPDNASSPARSALGRQAAPRPAPAALRAKAAAVLAKPRIAAANASTKSLPPAIAGLLESGLPPEGSGWTKESRDKFLTTFSTVLDFVFPIVKAVPAKDNDGQGSAAA